MWFWVVWLVAALLLVGIEIHTQAFFAIFLALGAFGATIVTASGGPIWLSVVVFAAIAVAGTALLRPALRRVSERHFGPRLTLPGASDSLVGQPALTLDTVGDEHHPGHARLAGERWLAMTSSPGTVVAPETTVLVVAVRGTTLIVSPPAAGG